VQFSVILVSYGQSFGLLTSDPQPGKGTLPMADQPGKLS
jgi:hypothetical protein